MPCKGDEDLLERPGTAPATEGNPGRFGNNRNDMGAPMPEKDR